MDIKALDKTLAELTKCKAELASLDYNNPKYDEKEDALHALEDQFQEAFGAKLEEILQDIHDEFCSDNDVLMPMAYLGKGVVVEADDYPGKDTRLLLVPNPPRIVLVVGKEKEQTVWTAQ
jgi:hypothetical protein